MYNTSTNRIEMLRDTVADRDYRRSLANSISIGIAKHFDMFVVRQDRFESNIDLQIIGKQYSIANKNIDCVTCMHIKRKNSFEFLVII
jgi:hypothetical protein